MAPILDDYVSGSSDESSVDDDGDDFGVDDDNGHERVGSHESEVGAS